MASKLHHLKVFALPLYKGKRCQKLLGGTTSKPFELQELLVPFWIPPASLQFEGRGQVDGTLFRIFQAQLNFGILLHKSALSPQLWYQTVYKNLCDNYEMAIINLHQPVVQNFILMQLARILILNLNPCRSISSEINIQRSQRRKDF